MSVMMNLRASARRALGAVMVAAAAVSLFATGAAAQNVTSGQIRGRVTNAEGQGIASASVIARNTQTGLERSALTDPQGQYIIRLLPPGIYNVRSEVIGYSSSQLQGVRVIVAQSATANITMQTQAVTLGAITVAAQSRPIDVSDAAVQKTVGLEQIQELPSLGRDFTDFINLSGMVAPNPEVTTGGQFSIAGLRPSQTNIQIDGVDANNAYFGENRGGSRIPFTFSLESIREFQVVSNGYDVEYGNYSGGVVNVVTRGGANDLDGSIYANFRDGGLTARDFDGTKPRDFEVLQYAGRVSGPIKRDKAFFLFSLDGQRRREPQRPITPEFYYGLSTPDSARADSLQRFWQILENNYGVQGAAQTFQPYSSTNDALTLFGRVDWEFNKQHRLSVRHNFSTYRNENEAAPTNFGRSRAELNRDWSNSFVSELQSVFSPTTFNVLRFQVATEDRPRQGNELRPGLQVNLLGSTQVGYGGAGISFYNNLDERKFQLIDNLTHVRGDHTFKVGFNGMLTRNKNVFSRLGGGLYEFRSLADLEAYRPYRYTRVLAANGEVPAADFEVMELGIYAQDEWQATPKLTATFGLRYDQERFLDPPGRVVDVERALGLATGSAPVDNDNISPRVALAYDVRGNGRSVVRAGAGYFYGRVPYVLAGNVNSTDVPVVTLTCEGSILRGDPSAPPNVQNWADLPANGLENPFSCAGAAGSFAPPEYSFWSDEFEFPETFKGNVGYEQLLGERTRAGVDLVYSRSTKLYTVRNINLRDAQFELAGEGSRRVFTPAAQFGPSSASTQHLRNNTFSNVFVNYTDGRSQSFAATFDLNHRFSEAVNFSASYTFTRAYDNSSFTCCTAFAGWTDPRMGRYGPNEIGGAGDEDRGWGPSEFAREHTIIATVDTRLPLGFNISAFWRLQSGNPWSPENSGDLNGDGSRFNDRPFIFAPENLPLAATGTAAEEQRARYSEILADNECIADYVGQIIPRNTCRQPWFNRLDMRVTRRFETVNDQRAELQVDLFNVVNGIGQLFCDTEKALEERTLQEGTCGWGKYVSVRSDRRNLLNPIRYDPTSNQILYEVSNIFGERRSLGSDLLLQFQAQVALRYYF